MRILFIDPPFKRFTGFIHRYYPMELAYIAATLRLSGFQDVAIFDADVVNRGNDIDFRDEYQRLQAYRVGLHDKEHVAWKDIIRLLNSYEPDVVCIAASITRCGSVLKTAEIVKRYCPDCRVVIEGQYPTIMPDTSLKSKYIDFAIRGEGEQPLLKLINALKDRLDIGCIPGLSYRKDGKIIHNEDQSLNHTDIDIFPSRESLLNAEYYTGEDMGMMVTARGCPFKCAFCALVWNGRLLNQSRVRYRKIDSIIEEIRYVRDRFGTRQFIFYDNSFGVNRNRTLELCERMIKERLNINWSCATRVNLIDSELLKQMKLAGCNLIKIGIESGSKRILKILQKDISIEQIREASRLLNRSGIFWGAYFMMGIPVETEDDMRQTYTFMKEINPPHAGIFLYTPYPSTRLFDIGVKAGIYTSKVDLNHFLTRHPRDYFLIEPARRTVYIEPERFQECSRQLLNGFYQHNVRVKSILWQFLTRRKTYWKDGNLLWSDILKGIKWITKRV